MIQRIALVVYSAVMWCLQPLVRAKLARRALAEPLYGQYVDERFGYYTQPALLRSADAPLVWVHAVSLGETRAAALLIAQLRLMVPDMRLLLTHSTATGRAEGLALLQAADHQAWLPWDTAGACQRFLTHFAPQMGVLMETEVWPQMCAQAHSVGLPMALVNARLNSASLRKAQHLAWLAKPAYASLHMVLAQTKADAQRLRAAGAAVQQVVGNLKFDAQRDAASWSQGQAWRFALGRPVVMLAASRDGEEALFLEKIWPESIVDSAQEAIKSIANSDQIEASTRTQKQSVKPLWLIVPRHPQRFHAVAQLLMGAGLQVARRSAWVNTPPAQALTADAWLGDSMGEMAQYYALADVALLGGSFAPLGGQNLIEAIACGCPIIMGPHTFNFDEAARTAQEQGAALRATDMQAAVGQALGLLGAAEQRAAMQTKGLAWLDESRGAAARTAQAIADVLTR